MKLFGWPRAARDLETEHRSETSKRNIEMKYQNKNVLVKLKAVTMEGATRELDSVKPKPDPDVAGGVGGSDSVLSIKRENSRAAPLVPLTDFT